MSAGPGPAAKLIDIGDLLLESGVTLHQVRLACETWGEINAERDNTILVTHPFTASAHAASQPNDASPGWWESLIGAGKALDTEKYFVICVNVVGGCHGSTGPTSINPAAGEPFGPSFPRVTIRDMVAAERQLLELLGIERLAAVIGASMGGMQALEWAVTFPGVPARIAAFAAPGRTSARVLAWNHLMRVAIGLDKRAAKAPSSLLGNRPELSGLSLARMIGMTTYETEASWNERFGRNSTGQLYAVDAYLESEARAFAERFDSESLIALSHAIDSHDLGRGRGGWASALSRITCPVLLAPVTSDDLFPAGQVRSLAADLKSAGVPVLFTELVSRNGHDAILGEAGILSDCITSFLQD